MLLSAITLTIISICFLYYCRISEVLRIRIKDIDSNDRIILHGIKGSNSYIIYCPGVYRSIANVDDLGLDDLLFPISYQKVYRSAKKAGIFYSAEGSQNNKVLHASRYIFCNKASLKVTNKELSQLMRHKSQKAILSYLK